MCLVSSLESAESPPAMKYWNTRAKQSPHVALPDTQKMARLASSERFHKRGVQIMLIFCICIDEELVGRTK